MTKRITYLILLCVAACTKNPDESAQDKNMVLYGILHSQDSTNSLNYGSLNENQAGYVTHTLADITISGNTSGAVSLQSDNTSYNIDNDYLLMPDSVYILQVNDPENEVRAEVKVHFPPAINLTSTPLDTIHITNPGSVAGLVDWNSLENDRYSFIFRLENLEQNPIPLPIDGDLFDQRYNGPQLQSQVVLLESDFGFYGRHRLSVFAINKEFEDVFFYDPSDLRGLLRNGPDNITGAGGFVAGVSGFMLEFIVQD